MPWFERLRWVAVCGFVSFAGCSGNGKGLDANGRPLSTAPQPLVAELQSIQDHVFTPICAACHAGAAAPLGFRLDQLSAYAMLVNAPSVEVPSLLRVSPGNPDQSYIIQKIEGHAAVGSQMPLGGPPLPQATIAVIRQWITNGAMPNTAAAAMHRAIQLQALAPLAGERFVPASSETSPEILVAADGELDTTLLGAANVSLIRIAGSNAGSNAGGGADSEAVIEPVIEPLTISVRSLAPTVFALSPAARVFVPGHYRLTISSRGQEPLAGRDGFPIGRDLVLEFDVEPTP